ncbi:DUF397 domain-containing protein [Streptomyces sp. NPDC006372]|uniref:DUF397 domain-containing protein n=1 Tax=Streptomyces sp. NPDC006372 TaxID=3155599 RepID=UPI0033A93405
MATTESGITGWHKSSYSGGDQGECLEVAHGHFLVPVRDSKTPGCPTLAFSTSGWAVFVTAIKEGHIKG